MGKAWHTGEAVRELLGKGRPVVEAAALEMNLSSTTIYRWCLRDDWPDYLLDRLADHLGVRVSWLRTGKGAKHDAGADTDSALDKHLEMLAQRYAFDIQRVTKRYTREIVEAIKHGRDGDGTGAIPLSTTKD